MDQTEPHQAAVEQLFPSWRTWTGADRRPHASPRDGPAIVVTGEDWRDLADEMRRADQWIAGHRFGGMST